MGFKRLGFLKELKMSRTKQVGYIMRLLQENLMLGKIIDVNIAKSRRGVSVAKLYIMPENEYDIQSIHEEVSSIISMKFLIKIV
jgi:hypothetical protein